MKDLISRCYLANFVLSDTPWRKTTLNMSFYLLYSAVAKPALHQQLKLPQSLVSQWTFFYVRKVKRKLIFCFSTQQFIPIPSIKFWFWNLSDWIVSNINPILEEIFLQCGIPSSINKMCVHVWRIVTPVFLVCPPCSGARNKPHTCTAMQMHRKQL